MPTYLRWIAAITAGITAQFAFFIVVGAIAVGTDNRELSGTAGLLATLGSTLVTLLAALGINDWLAARYPKGVPQADIGAGLKEPDVEAEPR